MVVLWLCNISLPAASAKTKEKARVQGGWIQSLLEQIISDARIDRLIYLFPQKKEKNGVTGTDGKLQYIGFYSAERDPGTVPRGLTEVLRNILLLRQPDLIHIMGTEYAHCVSMVDAAEKAGLLSRLAVSIQGMPSFCCRHYLTGIPAGIVKRKRLKDVIYSSSLIRQQRSMEQRGECEKYVLKKASYVIGRTEWDAACTALIHPDRKYFHGSEILRGCFYEGAWNADCMERHSVFVSQATYPVKGFHLFLEAAGLLIRKYRDLKIYAAGRDCYGGPSWKRSSYEKYVCDLIKKNGLEENVVFTGELSAEEMKKRYLRCHVFVSASTIENSPNSLGEAMILGVPSVASDVGGVKDMLVHQKEGFLYPSDEPYMLAYYIDRIFADDGLAKRLGRAAQAHAGHTHDREKAVKELFGIYGHILKKQ